MAMVAGHALVHDSIPLIMVRFWDWLADADLETLDKGATRVFQGARRQSREISDPGLSCRLRTGRRNGSFIRNEDRNCSTVSRRTILPVTLSVTRCMHTRRSTRSSCDGPSGGCRRYLPWLMRALRRIWIRSMRGGVTVFVWSQRRSLSWLPLRHRAARAGFARA